MLSVIIVAAGSSRRMGFDKLMAPLAGKPVLYHTVQAFLKFEQVIEVIVVTNADRFSDLDIKSPKLKHVEGGADRHNSVAHGIVEVSQKSSYIAVHDGARPLISADQIQRTLTAAQKHGASTSARKVSETVKRSNQESFATESVNRENLWLMETPQIFKAALLKQAYASIEKTGELVTDEVSALESIGIATFLVENSSLKPNLKITYPHDLALAEQFFDFD